MRPLLGLICFLSLAAPGTAMAGPAEEAAYRKVAAARTAALQAPADEQVEAFERKAEAFLKAHPAGDRTREVRRWLRGLKNRAPPRLAVDRWVGPSIDPHEITGEVTAVFFFSWTHPQTQRALPLMADLHGRLARYGLRVVGVATVVDDHASQTPALLRTQLERQRLPFPVAIDRQVAGNASVSYARYHGQSLPWLALVDRYGRLASLQPASPTANNRARITRTVNALLREQPHATLVAQAAAGVPAAMDRLENIRTPQTFSALLDLMGKPLAPNVQRRCDEIVRGLAPKGFPVDDPVAARRSWRMGRYRYSPETDRLVSR